MAVYVHVDRRQPQTTPNAGLFSNTEQLEITMKKTSIAIALLAGAMLPVAALADSTAWDFSSVGSSLNNSTGYSLGEVFTVTSNIYVDYLGYYAVGGSASSLTEDHGVAIYDAAGNLLTASTVNSSAGYTDNENFAFNSVSTI